MFDHLPKSCVCKYVLLLNPFSDTSKFEKLDFNRRVVFLV
jgi:hypothetical protein